MKRDCWRRAVCLVFIFDEVFSVFLRLTRGTRGLLGSYTTDNYKKNTKMPFFTLHLWNNAPSAINTIKAVIRLQQFKMKLSVGKTLWGVDANPGNWDDVFGRIKSEGFEAIECVAALSFQADAVLFKDLLAKHGLKLIVQIHTNGGFFKDGAYVYCLNADKDQHLANFQSQVKEALEMGAFLINAHSGHDSWSLDTAVSYFEEALEIEKYALSDPAYSHVTIVHETHRQRLMYSPFQTRDILKHPQLKQLKINADLSHWVCVCERVFDLNDCRDSSVIIIANVVLDVVIRSFAYFKY